MKQNNLMKRWGAALLALLLLVSLCPAAAAAETGAVSIGTLEELTAFAERCSSDAYSRNLTAALTADIDAEGMEIPSPSSPASLTGRATGFTMWI